MHYDVVIVGAGPGGCMAARRLVLAGFKVLLVEKSELPREKPCGGFISPEAVEMIEESFGPLPGDCLAHPAEVLGARLLVEGGGQYELPFSAPGRSVLRSRMDAHLVERCGAEVMVASEVESFDMERFHVRAEIKTREGEVGIESTYMVGADGADSLVSRLLRPEFHRLYAQPGLERTMMVLTAGEIDWDPEWIGLVFLKEGKGIGRLFLKEGMIGMAVNYDLRCGWKDELGALLSFLRDRKGLKPEGEPIRLISASNRMGAGGHYNLGAGCSFLVGEAAGLLDPWGFGIRLALESGNIAAESLVESAGERMTPHLRYHHRMQGLLDSLQRQRRDLSGRVGDLETLSLAGDRSRSARRDRRFIRRRL